MANKNINWMGNPVVDANAPPPPPPPKQGARMPHHEKGSANQSMQMMAGETGMSMADREGAPSISEPGYIPNFLYRNIGKKIIAEFIINNSFIDKVGILVEVGFNYFVLEDTNTNDLMMCDLYSVKFVQIIR